VREDGIVAVATVVAAQVLIPGARLAFVQTGSQQTTATIGDARRAAGLGSYTLDQVLGSIRDLPLNAGEAWGRLRIFPTAGQRLAPTDIPVFEELPLDLSVVAGVSTKAVQDSNSCGRREAEVAGHGAQGPRQRAARLQAGARARRPLTSAPSSTFRARANMRGASAGS
jgi:hypothetical protein